MLPRNAPVGKGAKEKEGERRKTLDREIAVPTKRNISLHAPQTGLLSFGVLILSCITLKTPRLILVRLFFSF